MDFCTPLRFLNAALRASIANCSLQEVQETEICIPIPDVILMRYDLAHSFQEII